MIKCSELGMEFASKEEMFRMLKANEAKLISLKKAQVYKSCEKGQIGFLNIEKVNGAFKADFAREGFVYPVISTTRYMDSHKDVHFDGCFRQTASDQQGKVMYALDHKLEYDSILAWPKDVTMYVKSIPWSMVGKGYDGNTEALVFEIPKSAFTREDVLRAIENKSNDFENSIRMMYTKITLGIDSSDKDLAQNKTYWDSRIAMIANKEQALENGYFWGVDDLKIYKEGSLVVAGGSNDATAIILGAEALTPKFDPQPAVAPIKTFMDFLN